MGEGKSRRMALTNSKAAEPVTFRILCSKYFAIHPGFGKMALCGVGTLTIHDLMKSSIRFFVGVFALGVCFNLAVGETTTASAPGPAQAASAASQTRSSGFSEQQILETWGWIIAQKRGVDHIELSDAQLSTFLKGVAEGFKGVPCPYEYGKIMPDVERMAKARREKVMRAITDKNRAEAKTFFTELDRNTNVVKLPSGLRYQIIRPGTGPCPKPAQTVNVHYLGHLLNGTEFIQMGPVDFVLWTNRFNSYLFEGLQKINKGGLMRLYVSSPPSEREVAWYGIQPGSTMIYEVELLDIKDTPSDVLEITLVPDAPEPGPPPPSGYSEQQILETWGWNTARKMPVSSFGLGEGELSLLTKGLIAGVKGQPPPYDLEKINPEVEKFIDDRTEKARQAFQQKQTAETEAFFTELQKNANVVKLPSGLCYEIIKPGSGPYPNVGKTVKIQYAGRLLNGKVFDQTGEGHTRNIELSNPPRNWVIPGWNEGLQKINKGGKIKLYVPPSLGYGDRAENRAPPYSTLIFEIEVVDIIDTPPPDDPVPAPEATRAPETK
jgi:FKBP-type peptidyl-prolyl cis-trans isomerase